MKQILTSLKACIAMAILPVLAALTPSAAAVPLDGTFIYTSGWGAVDIKASIAEAHLLQMKTLIILSTKQKIGECSTNVYVPDNYLDSIGIILDEAEANGMTVYVGLINSMNACPGFYDGASATNTVAETQKIVEQFNSTYGSRAAFAGWYIPDEPALASWVMPDLTHSYYQRLVSAIKSVSNKDVLVAPYLGGVQYSPAIVGQRALAFKNATGVDIQVWQDGVGSYSVPLHAKNGEPILGDYFAAISKAITSPVTPNGPISPNAFWSDNELFNYPPIPENSTPASIARIKAQLLQSQYASKRIAFVKQALMSYTDSSAIAGSKRLYDSYVATEEFKPISYQWITPPSSENSDIGNALFDGVTGDPKLPSDPAWVGVRGNAAVQFDFGQIRKFHWIGAHVLRNDQMAIAFPKTMNIYGSNDTDGEWTLLSSSTLPVFLLKDGDFVFSNDSPMMNGLFRYVKVELLNDANALTFVSELEIALHQ